MANIRGLIGFNPFTDTARLLAAYGNDIVNVTTGTGYNRNLGSTDVEFEKFLDRVFIQDYTIRPQVYRSDTNVFENRHVGRTPRSKYIKKFKSKLYLGYCRFTGAQQPLDPNTDGVAIQFPSRVFLSDFFTGPELTWGLEWGRNGLVQPNTNIFYLQDWGSNYPIEQDFKARNIKVGDPLIILNSDTPSADVELNKTHFVTKVDSAFRLHLDTTFTGKSNGALIDYYVGSNWFDVAPDDGDSITGFGENSDRLLIFKLMSLWFYTGSQRRQVQGALGTSYNRSVINDRYGNTYYFHGSDPKITGIYKYNGVASVKISRAIDPWILGMATGSYDNVIAWAEGNELRWFIGNLTANNYIEAVNNIIITLNVDTNAWSVDPCQDTITAVTTWRTSNEEDTYTGTSDDEILQMDDGNSHNTTAISALLESKVYYPSGSELINEFPYVQIISRNARGIRVKYKLWDQPGNVDDKWWSLGQIEGDKTEFTLPKDHQSASGIQFRFDEMSTVEKDAYVEKISIFYRPNRTRLL